MLPTHHNNDTSRTNSIMIPLSSVYDLLITGTLKAYQSETCIVLGRSCTALHSTTSDPVQSALWSVRAGIHK